MKHFIDGTEKVVQGSDGSEGVLVGAAMAVADARNDKGGIDGAKSDASIVEFNGQSAVVPTGSRWGSGKTEVVVDEGGDVEHSGEAAARVHDFFRRAAASF
jgi:hypothetical protein